MARVFPYPTLAINHENGLTAGAGIKVVNLGDVGVSLSASVRFGGAKEAEFSLAWPWRRNGGWWCEGVFQY